LAWVGLMTNTALGLCLSRQTLPLLAGPGETGNRPWTQAWMRPFLRITRLVRPRVAPPLSEVTSSGLDLDVLEDLLSRRSPKLPYTIPMFHNPTGVSMDLLARRRLIELAVKYRVLVIEDDIYGELRYEGAALPALKALDQHGLVLYLNSFSKT